MDVSTAAPVLPSLTVTVARAPGSNSQNIIRQVIDRVAHTAVLIEALIDPEVLILAGPVVEVEELIEALETRINDIRPPERRGRTTTVRSQIGRMNTPSSTSEANYRVAIIVALQLLDADIAGMLHTSYRRRRVSPDGAEPTDGTGRTEPAASG